MARYERFTFLCNPNERKLIANLASELQRSQSDAVRFVVLNAARQLTESLKSTTEPHPQPSQAQEPVRM